MHVACGFPALRAPAHFTPRVIGPIRLERLPSSLIRTSVLREESQGSVKPFPAPSFPAEALTVTCPGQVSPNPRLYPVSDIGETQSRVAYRKVRHPTS